MPPSPTRPRSSSPCTPAPALCSPTLGTPGRRESLNRSGSPPSRPRAPGIAWAAGLPDGGPPSRDAMLDAIGRIVAAVGVPVTADLEEATATPRKTWAAPWRGSSSSGPWAATSRTPSTAHCSDIDDAVARLEAARAAAPRGTFVLNARTDAYLSGTDGDPFDETVERALRYVDAGADCIFVPGVVETGHDTPPCGRHPSAPQRRGRAREHRRCAHAVLARRPRVSLGGGVARAALSLVERAGRELLLSGTLGFLDGAVSYAELQRRFGH